MGDLLIFVLLALQVAGFGLLLYLYLSLRSAIVERDDLAASYVSPPASSATTGLSESVGEMIRQLQRTADEIARELEDRAARLQDLLAEVDRRLDHLEAVRLTPGDALAQVSAPDSPAEAAIQDDAEAGGSLEPRPDSRDLVLQLADQGKSSWEIAQQTRSGREEVELLLKLHRRTK